MDNDLPVLVFNMLEAGNLKRAMLGEPIGTVVRGGES
jgi:uridylate kinase